MGPAVVVFVSIKIPGREGVSNLRKDQPTQSTSASTQHIASPLPSHRNVPDRKRNIAHDIHAGTKNHRWPSRSLEESIARPRIDQGRENSDRISSRRIRINLRNRILGILALLQKLLEGWLRSRCSVVEEDVK